MIEIYEFEQKAGLADVINESFAKGVVLCESPIIQKAEGSSETFLPPEMTDEVSLDVALVYAVLVSMDWNRNDDVFTPVECWSAAKTPLLKPANQDHQKSESDDENKIIGVIRESYPVNSKYQIADSQENLEHIVCGISLWERYWPSAVADIKENIDDGTQFVSMECLFKGFGYALRAADGSGSIQLLPRNKETSKLSRFLRAFKGPGKVTIEGKEYQIGRWLRDIVFTGVGFVKKPANPNSIVFNNYVSHASASESAEPKFSTISEINLTKIEENSDNSVLQDSQNAKEESMADVKETPKTEEIKVEAAPVVDEALAAKVTEAEKRCADLQAMCDKVQAEYNTFRSECQVKYEQMNKEYQTMSECLNKKENELRMLQATIDTMRRTAMANDRYTALASIEMTSILEESDEAKAKDKVANFTEAEWKTILTMAQKFVAKQAVVADTKPVTEPSVETEVAEASEDKSADEAKAAEAAAAAASQTETPSTGDQLKAAFSKHFGKKTK